METAGRQGKIRCSTPTCACGVEDASWLALLTKRLVDVAGSVVALLVLVPLWAVIAAATKLSSKGPILYRQVRIGL